MLFSPVACTCCFVCSCNDCSVSSESECEELPEDETESVSEPSTDASEKDAITTTRGKTKQNKIDSETNEQLKTRLLTVVFRLFDSCW